MKNVLDGQGGLCIVIYAPNKPMTAKSELASLPAPAVIAPTMTHAEALSVATKNAHLARKAEDLATMAVWEADLGKDNAEARAVYRNVVIARREAEALVHRLVEAK